MVRSGLQQDVLNMYKRGVKMVLSKPKEIRQPFWLHLRHSFHNPPLGPRDYTAIEHQLRKMDRTLEMLETGHVQRIGVTQAMEEWWADQVKRNHQKPAAGPASGMSGNNVGSEKVEKPKEKDEAGESVTERGDSGKDNSQWGGALPGHGGT